MFQQILFEDQYKIQYIDLTGFVINEDGWLKGFGQLHKDKFNTDIALGQIAVCGDRHNSLLITRVKKINPKMISLSPLKSKYTINRYPSDIIVLDSSAALLYVLGHE